MVLGVLISVIKVVVGFRILKRQRETKLIFLKSHVSTNVLVG